MFFISDDNNSHKTFFCVFSASHVMFWLASLARRLLCLESQTMLLTLVTLMVLLVYSSAVWYAHSHVLYDESTTVHLRQPTAFWELKIMHLLRICQCQASMNAHHSHKRGFPACRGLLWKSSFTGRSFLWESCPTGCRMPKRLRTHGIHQIILLCVGAPYLRRASRYVRHCRLGRCYWPTVNSLKYCERDLLELLSFLELT